MSKSLNWIYIQFESQTLFYVYEFEGTPQGKITQSQLND